MTTNNTFNNQNREENNTFCKTNVANNVAQRNSQDLTKQWKKGELENGEYFVLTNLGVEKIEYIKEHNGFGFDEIEWVEEILAPVPSFEEWQELSKQRNQLIRDVKDLAYVQEENQRLKELLKECRNCVTRQIYGSPTRQYWEGVFDDKLLTKIDEVLNVPSE